MNSNLLRCTIVAVMLCAALPCLAQGKGHDAAGKVLYNGIVLPQEWPPRYAVPLERKPMPLPYIDNKPCPIIINVGRQLFVDDFLIESTTLERVCHRSTLVPENPILQTDQDWEWTPDSLSNNLPFSGGVWYDERIGKFRLWYSTHPPKGVKHGLACAVSDDGVHWTKPSYDVVPGTNLTNAIGGDAVWIDKEEKDPTKRYKNIISFGGPIQLYLLQYSADGIHWRDSYVHSGRIQDRSTAYLNRFTNKWCASMRVCALDPPSRSRAYLEDDNIERMVQRAHWVQDELDSVIKHHTKNYVLKDTDIVFWFTADDKDLRHPDPRFSYTDPAIYNLDANAYESVLMGTFAMWRGPENNVCDHYMVPKHNEVGLGYSRDGFHWARPDHVAFIPSNIAPNVWNAGNMQAAVGCPLIVGDSLYFYTGGHRLNKISWDGDTFTGMSSIRRDGFVSMDAGATEGTLTTSPVTFDGKYFFVNAIAKNLAVEVLDEKGQVLKGYSKDECVPMKNGNSTKYRITWNKKADLGKLRNKKVKFKFYLTDGALYAFWLSPWETGESRGYTGGGGPGLHPSGIDLPWNENVKAK